MLARWPVGFDIGFELPEGARVGGTWLHNVSAALGLYCTVQTMAAGVYRFRQADFVQQVPSLIERTRVQPGR